MNVTNALDNLTNVNLKTTDRLGTRYYVNKIVSRDEMYIIKFEEQDAAEAGTSLQ